MATVDPANAERMDTAEALRQLDDLRRWLQARHGQSGRYYEADHTEDLRAIDTVLAVLAPFMT